MEVLGVEPKTVCMLRMCSATGLYPHPPRLIACKIGLASHEEILPLSINPIATATTKPQTPNLASPNLA